MECVRMSVGGRLFRIAFLETIFWGKFSGIFSRTLSWNFFYLYIFFDDSLSKRANIVIMP